MNFREITDGIYYTGVNDRVTEKFEGMWPLPAGVSYNSYVVKGSEKVALIDGVDIDLLHPYLGEVHDTIGDRKIDYMVIHHMEPDHSGAIPDVLRRWPDLKIVGNTQTIGMIKGFYHILDDSCFLTVKEGDTLDLGGLTLKFVMTPMVHWPETMMSYVPERRLLFSGDAFGCFGALNGAVTDAEMDTDLYWDEMYRYYSNIVGKYGKFVQKAMAKLTGVPLDYICSTHGPVWHEEIAKVTGIYDRLSRYESEPGATIIYGSMYGNTAELAEEMARGLAEAGVRTIRVHSASTSNMSDMIRDAFRYQILVVGSATYSMTLFPPVAAFLTAMKVREVTGKTFAGFGGYTWAPNAVRAEIEAFARTQGLELQGFVAMKQSIDAETRRQAHELGVKLGTHSPASASAQQ